MSKKKKGGKLPKFVVGEGNLYGEKPTIEYDFEKDMQTIFLTGDPNLIKRLRKAFAKSGVFSSITRTAPFSLTLKMDAKTSSPIFVAYAVKAYVYFLFRQEEIISVYEQTQTVVPGELNAFFENRPPGEQSGILEALRLILANHQHFNLSV